MVNVCVLAHYNRIIIKHAHNWPTLVHLVSSPVTTNCAFHPYVSISICLVRGDVSSSVVPFEFRGFFFMDFIFLQKFHELIDRCDSDDDCGDMSDEANCPSSKHPCLPHMFQCKSDGKCIPEYFVCDHDKDCVDGSDEQSCSFTQCKEEEFKCKNGRCINKIWSCGKIAFLVSVFSM